MDTSDSVASSQKPKQKGNTSSTELLETGLGTNRTVYVFELTIHRCNYTHSLNIRTKIGRPDSRQTLYTEFC